MPRGLVSSIPCRLQSDPARQRVLRQPGLLVVHLLAKHHRFRPRDSLDCSGNKQRKTTETRSPGFWPCSHHRWNHVEFPVFDCRMVHSLEGLTLLLHFVSREWLSPTHNEQMVGSLLAGNRGGEHRHSSVRIRRNLGLGIERSAEEANLGLCRLHRYPGMPVHDRHDYRR